MSNGFRSSLLSTLHVVLAFATGAALCVCAALLLLDRPSGLLGAGAWIDGPAAKYTLGILGTAAAAGVVVYLHRAARLGRRTWITLVAAIPTMVVAVWLFFGISLMLHPVGF